GRVKAGDRLPSEAELERTFGASRITVGRAVRDLQLAGLVERRAGSGSYVKARNVSEALSFGLLIPDLGETEIFEPICQGMMASPPARQHALLWGSLTSAAPSKEERAWQLCRQYIDRRASGVFFAPLELVAGKDAVHRLDPTDLESVRALMASEPEAVVCANDWTAARLMHSILELGYSVPGNVRLVGIDDLEYASLLPVPLTTLRQPTREIGAAAFAAMLDRVSRPDTPVRDILLQTQLVVRRSCGASVEGTTKPHGRSKS